MSRKRATHWTVLAATLIMASGCGGAAPEDAAPQDATPQDTTPRLVWLSPEDGAEVGPLVHLEFDAVNYEIAAVPEGTVETARPGIAHHHVGMAGECLPAGTMIPRDNPEWIHFGDGSNTIDLQLAPGEHTLAIQAGNDLHEAVEGLCETVTFTVVSEG